MRVTRCVHYWFIDSYDVGRCRKCGRVKDFGRLLEKERQEKMAKLYPYARAKKGRKLRVRRGMVRRGRPRKKGLWTG